MRKKQAPLRAERDEQSRANADGDAASVSDAFTSPFETRASEQMSTQAKAGQSAEGDATSSRV